jgi:hypothetical protein
VSRAQTNSSIGNLVLPWYCMIIVPDSVSSIFPSIIFAVDFEGKSIPFSLESGDVSLRDQNLLWDGPATANPTG